MPCLPSSRASGKTERVLGPVPGEAPPAAAGAGPSCGGAAGCGGSATGRERNPTRLPGGSMTVTIVRTAVSPLVILSSLERAHAALAGGDIVLGRQFVDR